MPPDPVVGLYDQLVSEELRRILAEIEPSRIVTEPPDAADAPTAIAEYLRRIIERALRATPEKDRAARQADLCNALLSWLRQGAVADVVGAEEALALPMSILREVKAVGRGAALSPPRRLTR